MREEVAAHVVLIRARKVLSNYMACCSPADVSYPSGSCKGSTAAAAHEQPQSTNKKAKKEPVLKRAPRDIRDVVTCVCVSSSQQRHSKGL
jgi:hypothetical protein